MKWYQSRTIWAAVAGIICLIGGTYFRLTEDSQRQLSDVILTAGPNAAAAIAAILTIFFRVNAKGDIK